MRKKYRLPIESIQEETFDMVFALSDQIEVICKKLGWTRTELSKITGIDRRTLNRIEHGKNYDNGFASRLLIMNIYDRSLDIPDPKEKYKVKNLIGGKKTNEIAA